MLPTAMDDPRLEPPRRGRRRRWPLIAGLLVVLLVAVAGAGAFWYQHRDDQPDLAQDPALQGQDVPRAGPAAETAVGVFRGTDPQGVRDFQTWLGKPVELAVDFSPRATWDDVANPVEQINTWRGQGFRMVYSLAMLPEEDRSATIEGGARGENDDAFKNLGRKLVAAGQADAIMRVGWEFNLESSRWHSDDPEAWKAYYRKIVEAMRSVPGQQFQFDWNPNNGDNPYDAVNYYPGDDVVDYVGVDAYDVGYKNKTYPYPSGCDQACALERQQNAWSKSIYGGARGLRFWSMFAKHHGKPMSLPEWGLWIREDGHGGGADNTYYLDQMHTFITDPNNDVGYQSYFEFDGHDGPHRLMTTFTRSGNHFKQLFGG